ATALASWAVAAAPTFATFLVAWAVQGCYTVWLPMEIAIIHLAAGRIDAADQPAMTRRAAALLVFALQAGVIAGALSAGVLVTLLPLPATLALPAVAVTACILAIIRFVPASPGTSTGALDTVGIAWLTASLLTLMAGLSLLRTDGPASPGPWLALAAALGLLVPFVGHELRCPEPLVDIRLLTAPAQWPVQVTSGLFGVSVLGAQVPLSTFARTDPAEVGYGLGLSAGQTSVIIGVYVLSLAFGALSLPTISRLLTPRLALVVASALVGTGYLLFLPFHASLAQTMTNMTLAGLGSGLLVAALPAAATASTAPGRAGMAAGLTNATRTVGGAVASALFGVALFRGVSGQTVVDGSTAAPLSGYLTVWFLCGATALICAAILAAVVPRTAFTRAS
ncbi:MAG: MFS transporter, partial [Propioniciclava sp.]